jgi:hypothetical protein
LFVEVNSLDDESYLRWSDFEVDHRDPGLPQAVTKLMQLRSDVGQLDALHAERDALVGELAAAAGLGGRSRVTGSSHERARVSATKAITAAIDRIATVDAPLGRHLRATIRTGLQCSYQPDPDDKRDWILNQPPHPPE